MAPRDPELIRGWSEEEGGKRRKKEEGQGGGAEDEARGGGASEREGRHRRGRASPAHNCQSRVQENDTNACSEPLLSSSVHVSLSQRVTYLSVKLDMTSPHASPAPLAR